jgi:hypothetical protein
MLDVHRLLRELKAVEDPLHEVAKARLIADISVATAI